MRTSLVVSEELWRTVLHHVLSGQKERFAFLLAERNCTEELQELLAVRVELVPDEAVNVSLDGYEVSTEALLRITNEAARCKLSLVEVHGHVLARKRVAFSPIDLLGQREMAAYLDGVLPHPYGALVVAPDGGWVGQYWIDGRTSPLDQITVTGEGVSWLRRTRRHDDVGERDARQVLALGDEGTRQLRSLHVAVVGVGGIGSHICQQLAYLGAGRLVLIDSDRVEKTNLNRLVGAGHADVGRLKVQVAKREIRRINQGVRVQALPVKVWHEDALGALRQVDIIIGAVDSDGPRVLLNELALAYAKPYIDCGTGIEAKEGQIIEAGGQIFVYLPGRACLLCLGLVSLRQAGFDLSSKEEQARAVQRGYVSGEDIEAPAVVFINGSVASLAVGEFVALATGIRPTTPYTIYDYLTNQTTRWPASRQPECPACAMSGIGDRIRIERYARLARGSSDDR